MSGVHTSCLLLISFFKLFVSLVCEFVLHYECLRSIMLYLSLVGLNQLFIMGLKVEDLIENVINQCVEKSSPNNLSLKLF